MSCLCRSELYRICYDDFVRPNWLRLSILQFSAVRLEPDASVAKRRLLCCAIPVSRVRDAAYGRSGCYFGPALL